MTNTPPPQHRDKAVQPTMTGSSQQDKQAGHGGHGWMMILCCLPMLVIAAVLLAVGVVSVGFLVFAVACTAMMAFMMRGMSHGG